MTIASEITKLNTNLTNSYTACQGKGATMPANQNFDNLATCIGSIQTGSTPTLITKNITANGTYNASSDDADGYSSVTVNVSGGGSKYGATGGTFLGDVDANGVLSYDSNTPTDLVFTGVRDLGNYALCMRFIYVLSTTSITSTSGHLGLSSIENVYFPNLENITGNYAMAYVVSQCTNLTSVYLANLNTISGTNAMERAFNGCTNLTSLDLSSLTTISGTSAMRYTFNGCTSLSSLDLSSLTIISGTTAMDYAFRGCTNLTSVDLSSLTTISSNNAMRQCFGACTSLTTLSFPSLTSTSFGSYTNQFNNMLKGVTGCTVHFPSNLQSVIGSWKDVTSGFGGTNTTVLFDLPATT